MSIKPTLKSKSGFTLIEMLVVLAILTVLAALLFSVFASVRERGRRTVCVSNLKQIGSAMQLYVEDNNHYFPPTMANTTNMPIWCDFLLPYVKSKQIYVCPTDTLQTPSWGAWANSYGYNHHIGGVTGFDIPDPSGENSPHSEGQILKPSDTVLVTDAGTTSTEGLPPAKWPLKNPPVFQIGDAFTHDGSNLGTGMMPAPAPRHSGHTNVLWADGHVNTRSIESFYNAPDHKRPQDKFTGISPCMRPDMGCDNS